MTDPRFTDHEPHHAESSTASLLTELQLYGHRPFQNEPDARPLPEDRTVRGALADIFDALVSTLADTRLEPDLEDLLWSTVNLFDRAGERIERDLDGNEQAQKRSQKDQDGSEIRSVGAACHFRRDWKFTRSSMRWNRWTVQWSTRICGGPRLDGRRRGRTVEGGGYRRDRRALSHPAAG